MRKTQTILVLGLGNLLMSDDGVGVHVVQTLAGRMKGQNNIICRDGGTLGLNLLPDIENAAALIAIDAAEINAAPGSLKLFEGPRMDALMGGRKRSAHEVSLADLMTAAAISGRTPARRALIAIQPETTKTGLSPSPPVAAAIKPACEMVEEVIGRWRQ